MSKKICILTDSLSFGGAEKVAANMSISLSNKGYNVFIVSMLNDVDYKYKGTLFNFGVIKRDYNNLGAFLKFISFFRSEKFDVIIDHRTRNSYLKELIFSKFIIPKSRVFYCVHNYKLEYYFSMLKTSWISLLPHVKNNTFISVSDEIGIHMEEKLNLKSKTIYNYLKLSKQGDESHQKKAFIKKYIIGVGRLTEIKQFDKLIRSYHASCLVRKGIKLIILGEGVERSNLERLVFDLKLQDFVDFLPFTNNPYDLIKNAMALVLTSKVEGFPMVLLEALSLNVPVIAFNCKSGPKEIIVNEKNGLLVENQNEERFVEALNKLLDESLYEKIKANTSIGLEKFSEEKIIQKWVSLIENHK
ncbi:glycosyltransferase [Seonamhaeicola maritimus]|uniref:Glycosyltransferase family 4 protein n=1 Tax=Seonamhaeicola maritimus TaxID=2591822 RepID=A0A5C7GDL0_9FLAO|nr:glycosyltransferase [Seonamhaeicola maritimus]TXG34557.1 glycosyltransferase family 4 protein [Seonamhaeicola maritimus]